jgi:hypothetical protein
MTALRCKRPGNRRAFFVPVVAIQANLATTGTGADGIRSGFSGKHRPILLMK